ncbi:hypothetical protein SBADM41S_10731 [Streptomyces badius]
MIRPYPSGTRLVTGPLTRRSWAPEAYTSTSAVPLTSASSWAPVSLFVTRTTRSPL